MPNKIKVVLACWATVIVIGIVLASVFVIVGWQDKLRMAFYLHFTVGAIVIFVVCWPIYTRRLK